MIFGFDNVQMNVKKAMDKLTEWNNVGNKLRHHIPDNDEVLHSWLSQLEEFSQDLPFLLQLSSDALKVKSMYCMFLLELRTVLVAWYETLKLQCACVMLVNEVVYPNCSVEQQGCNSDPNCIVHYPPCKMVRNE